MKTLFRKWNDISLVKRIIVGLVLGIVLALTIPDFAQPVALLGTLFVEALKAIAPILVLLLVMSAIAQHTSGQKTNMKSIIAFYMIGTFLAGFIAVLASFIFPISIEFSTSSEDLTAPGGVAEVLKSVLMNIVANPITAIAEANYIGILAWAIVLGFALKAASDTAKTVIASFSDAVTVIVGWVIQLAPFGIMGLVFESITSTGLAGLKSYGSLLMLLIGCMLFVAFVLNPIIVFIAIRQNPYPLVFKVLKESAITGFFTRSSAANIPVNMILCRKLGLEKETYSISIPLGATINMGGAAVTISVLTLAAAHTLGISVDFPTALLLSILAAVCAAGTSGVAGGSLLLIPLAASLFGISNDVAMTVVGIGFIVGVLQDSFETALNSSTDVLFTATAEFRKHRLEGNPVDVKERITQASDA